MIEENGDITRKGKVTGTGQVNFDKSFDYLSLSTDDKLYLFKDDELKQVTDNDLGTVIDHLWIDGYFMTTDGEFLVVTELTDSFAVNPLKYGSSEADPDPIKAVLRHRNEVYALNRNTIEVFKNVGGDYFPFQRVQSAQIQRGCVGTHACAVFQETIAFVGGKRDEPCAVWLGINGGSSKISTREIDTILQTYSTEELESILVETRIDKSHAFLYIHLPDRTFVYDFNASRQVSKQVWFTLASSIVDYEQYRGRNMVWVYDKWFVGDTKENQIGQLTNKTSHHYGDIIGWDFQTTIVYNPGGAIIHELELVALTGRVELEASPTVWTSYTNDGMQYSQEHPISAGLRGDRDIKLAWLKQGWLRHTRMQKFRGTSDAHITMSRLEAKIEPLNG